jgi:hypothetical protein
MSEKERVCYKEEDHQNWPNNQINVKPLLAHIINPGEITRFVHATDLA